MLPFLPGYSDDCERYLFDQYPALVATTATQLDLLLAISLTSYTDLSMRVARLALSFGGACTWSSLLKQHRACVKATSASYEQIDMSKLVANQNCISRACGRQYCAAAIHIPAAYARALVGIGKQWLMILRLAWSTLS